MVAETTSSEPSQQLGVARELRVVCALAALGALGAWPISAANAPQARAHPIVLLVWLALLAPAAGWMIAAARVRMLPLGATVPASWCALIALVDAFAPHRLPAPLWAALALAGLFLCGAALARLARGRRAGAGLLALSCAALVALPGAPGLQWSPSVAARLLDLSPATLVCESAGLDWMRHPSVYAPVGSDRFERAAWRGELAGPLALVVGCAALFAAARVASPRESRSR